MSTFNGVIARFGIRSRGAVIFPYTAVTSNYTVNSSNYVVDCTSGSFTVTLPYIVSNDYKGQIFVVKNSGTGTITVQGLSGQTIDGFTTKTLKPKESLTVQTDGVEWDVIANADQPIAWMGSWNSSTTYYYNNIVTYQGSSWVAETTNVNSTPFSGSS